MRELPAVCCRLLTAILADDRGETRPSIAGVVVVVVGALFVAWFIWTQIRFWVLVAIVVAVAVLAFRLGRRMSKKR